MPDRDAHSETHPLGDLLSPRARTAYGDALANDGVLAPDTRPETIAELEGLGLAQHVDSVWLAQSPTGPLSSVITDLSQRTTAVRSLALDLEREWTQHMVRSAPEWRTGDSAGLVADELFSEARHTAKALVLPPRGEGAVITMPKTQDSTLSRGVEIYGLYAAEVLDHPVGLEIARSSIRLGEHARLIQNLPFFALIVDSSVAAVTLPHDEFAKRQTVIMRHPGLVACFERLFDVLWEQGIPLSDEADATPEQAEDNQLLLLLAQGQSDRAIARQLGVSDRTLTRRITAVQQRLGARTRFQLGFQAARAMAASEAADG